MSVSFNLLFLLTREVEGSWVAKTPRSPSLLGDYDGREPAELCGGPERGEGLCGFWLSTTLEIPPCRPRQSTSRHNTCVQIKIVLSFCKRNRLSFDRKEIVNCLY